MNDARAEPFAWSTRKRWLVIAAAIGAQAGLLLWFSAHTPRPVRAADARPAVQLIAAARGEWLSVADPTLFSRAHREGFSGAAWLGVPTVPEPEKFPESAVAPVWLALATGTLGETFRAFVQTSVPDAYSLRNWPPPAPTAPTARPVFIAVTSSVVHVEGALAGRGLLKMPPLPSWPGVDVLPPSQVQVLVDARGNPVSALLLAGSGLKAADQAAVDLSLAAQFGGGPEALNASPGNPGAGLTFGRLIFRWHTLPVAAPTNGLPNPR